VNPFLIKLMLIVLLIPAAMAHAAAQSEREDLQQRFEQRHRALMQLHQQGRIGETWLGYVEAIDNSLVRSADIRLIEQENADRRRLYDLIAAEVVPGRERVPASVVAERNARRNFRNAQPDHYLKIDEGRWIQKRDENRATRLRRAKNDAQVGETWRGYIEAVPRAQPGQQLEALIAQENRDRERLYQRIANARGENVSVDTVAHEAGREILEHVAPGQHYLPRNGNWTRKPGRTDRN
jgi:uncharacterized protein YdbL (DUF1318 family)